MARLSAAKLKKDCCAIVVGHTIYLWGISKTNFLEDEAYLRHELQHILQYRQEGLLRFITKYLLESLRNGYYNNKFEVEARAAEILPIKEEFILIE